MFLNNKLMSSTFIDLHRKIIFLTQKIWTTKHNRSDMKQLTKMTPHALSLRQLGICHPSQKKKRQLRNQNNSC
ncbi:hypothetical protein GHT06_004974 [Daphnia sinensis]|uniref:Uncharacterized protein n=1 Tax=Daphnia sinensis TaxID=1820382 RepID=A0AAD5PMB1_9CRUS|nr:hypothetical protein GHT06_004974 [Daphnia sinensis]